MTNKKTKKLLLSVVIFFIFALVLLAGLVMAQNPPQLENHQFYGTVHWNASETRPQQVIAKVGTSQFTSAIKDIACGAWCNGTYGYAADNILRVQGSRGDTISFFLDTRFVLNFTYAPDTATKLDLDLRALSPPQQSVPPVSNLNATQNITCTSNWNCTEWSSCLNSKQSRTCLDKNHCTNVTLPQVNRSCTLQEQATCQQHWACTAWSGCSESERTRTCDRDDLCDEKLAAGEVTTAIPQLKPSESETCVSAAPTPSPAPSPAPPVQPLAPLTSCRDGKQNQGESGVDCGGPCTNACPREGGVPWYLYAGIGLVVALLIAGIIFYIVSHGGSALPLEQATQLRNYFQRSMAQGLSKEEITDKLVTGGWEEKTVKKFLKREKL